MWKTLLGARKEKVETDWCKKKFVGKAGDELESCWKAARRDLAVPPTR